MGLSQISTTCCSADTDKAADSMNRITHVVRFLNVQKQGSELNHQTGVTFSLVRCLTAPADMIPVHPLGCAMNTPKQFTVQPI